MRTTWKEGKNFANVIMKMIAGVDVRLASSKDSHPATGPNSGRFPKVWKESPSKATRIEDTVERDTSTTVLVQAMLHSAPTRQRTRVRPILQECRRRESQMTRSERLRSTRLPQKRSQAAHTMHTNANVSTGG